MGDPNEFVRVARSPDGGAFAVFVAPPGSLLDSNDLVGGIGAGAIVGLFVSALSSSRRALSKKWRVAVQRQLPDGRLGPVVARFALRTKQEAIDKAAEVARSIEDGSAVLGRD